MPEAVLEDERHWLDFIQHGYLERAQFVERVFDGFEVDQLPLESLARLLAFLTTKLLPEHDVHANILVRYIRTLLKSAPLPSTSSHSNSSSGDEVSGTED